MDTILGINNEGTLEFEPFVEWGDIKSSGGNVYNGQNQLFWQLFIELYGDKIAQTYKDMRAGNFNLEYLNEQYDEFQKAWGERLYNEDAEFSYIQPYLELGDESYFEMAQGMKTSQRHYFLKNRLDYLDSKFNAGNAIANVCTVRGYQANNLKVAYNMPIYASIKYGSQLVQDRVQTANTEIELPIPTGMTINDTETYIYSCDRLVSIDGLADYQIGYADFAKAINLQTLNIGKHNDPEYSNTHFNMLRLGNNKLLETLDCGGCTGLTGNIDVSGCSNLNTAYFNRTGITGITLPDGDTVKHIWLPNTLKQLKVVNQNIPDFNWNDGACAWNSLTQCWLENSTLQYDGMDIDIAYAIVNGDFQEGCYVRFIGYDYYLQNGTEATAFANTIASLHGIDERGQLVDNAVIDGDIYIEEPMSLTAYNNLVALMPYVTIHAEICPSIILNMETETRENNEDDPVVTTQSVELYSFADYEEPTIEEVDVPDLSQYRLKASSLPTEFSYESNASTVDMDVDYLKYQSTSLTYGLKYSGISTTNGHKYYYCMEIKTPVDAKLSVFSYVTSGNFDSVADTWQLIHLYTTSTGGALSGYFDYITSTGSSPYIAEIRNLRIYDLTAQYGAGNEPTESECVAQGCFLKKQVITGTTVTQEDIDTAINVAQLMYPNGKQIIQDNINIYKHLNECNYNNLLEGYLGEPVFEDIVIDATQYRKKVSNISRNIMYCSQSTHREALIPNLTLDQMKAITVNDSRLANHVNYDDPTETVPKPMAFSITKTNVREYTTADSFDLSTLTDELVFSEYLTRQWDFDTYDIRFDVYAIYNESVMLMLYGVNISKTAPEFLLNDLLPLDADKILRTIAIFAGTTSASEAYNSNKLYFVDLHDQDILAGLQNNSSLSKTSQYVLDKFGGSSIQTWDTGAIYYTSTNYEGIILLYDKQDEDYACIRFVMPLYPTTNYTWINYVFTLKQLFDRNNCQGWYLDKTRYSIVNILQQTPLRQSYSSGYQFQSSLGTYYPMFSNTLQVPRSTVIVEPLEFVAPLISGIFYSAKTYRLDVMLQTVEILGGMTSPNSPLFNKKRAWIVPVEVDQFSVRTITTNSAMYVGNLYAKPIEEKLEPIIDIIGDIDYTMKHGNGEYINIFDNSSSEYYYYTSSIVGNKLEYFMGFSDIQAGNTNDTTNAESNKYTHCATVDFALVLWNRAFNQDYDVLYAKKGFSAYLFDEDIPTFSDAEISSAKNPAIIPFKTEFNFIGYDGSSTVSNVPETFTAHFVTDLSCDNSINHTFIKPSNNSKKVLVNQGQMGLIKFRLFNTLKQDFRKGEKVILFANSYQYEPISPSGSSIGYGDGTSDLMTLVQIMDGTPSQSVSSLYNKSITVEMPSSVIFKLKNPNGEGFIDIDATNSIWVKSGFNANLYMKLSNFLNWENDYINGYNSNMHEVVIASTSSNGDCLSMAQYGLRCYEYTKGYYIDIRGLKREYAENQDVLSIINYWFPTDETKVDPNNTLIQFNFDNGRQSLPISGSHSGTATNTMFSQHNISTSSMSFTSKPNTFNGNGPCGKTSAYYFIDSAKPSTSATLYYNPITADGFYLRICPYGEYSLNTTPALSDTLIETGMSYGLVFGVVDYTNWTIKKGIMYFTVYPSNNEKYGLRVMRTDSNTPEILYRFPTPQLHLTKLMDVFECANGTTSPKTSEVDTAWRSIYMCIPRTYICDEELRAMSPIQDYRGVEKLMNDEDGIYGNFSFGMWDDFKSLGDNNTYGLDSFNECTYEQFKSVFLM